MIWRMSFADALKYVPKHPERTAYRPGTGDDYFFKRFPSQEALEKAVHKQGRRIAHYSDWRVWEGSNLASRASGCRHECDGCRCTFPLEV